MNIGFFDHAGALARGLVTRKAAVKIVARKAVGSRNLAAPDAIEGIRSKEIFVGSSKEGLEQAMQV